MNQEELHEGVKTKGAENVKLIRIECNVLLKPAVYLSLD